jgi:hypothetical protein
VYLLDRGFLRAEVMSGPGEIKKARHEIWASMPCEIDSLPLRHDVPQPAGNIIYAESITREYTELIWIFMEALRVGSLQGDTVRKAIGLILEHLVERLSGSHGLQRQASVVLNAREHLRSCPEDELTEILGEVRLYISRLNLWLDLLIPWHDWNEDVRVSPNKPHAPELG